MAGNVRELENLIERAAILTATGEIGPEDVQRCREVTVTTTLPAIPVSKATLTLKEAQREQIVRALRESAGNRSEAARRLGIDRKSLYRTARRMGIDFDAIGE